MSWNDPCSQCGEPRYNCKCEISRKTLTEEEKSIIDNKQKQNEEYCKIHGHNFEYGFIISTCTRCGEQTEY